MHRSFRQLKAHLQRLLPADNFAQSLNAIDQIPARKVISPLFGLLYHADGLIRWRAVSAIGHVVAHLAEEEMESARIIMRRLMWNLNDESGGIGWGSPEAMGDILARHDALAREYAAILISYINPDGNFLEYEGLQSGLLWGLGRAARVHPGLMQTALPFILPYLTSPNATLRGLAVWSGLPLRDNVFRSLIQPLTGDQSPITIYIDSCFHARTIADLAAQADV